MFSIINIFLLILFVLLCLYLVILFYLRKGLLQVYRSTDGYHPNVSIIVSMHNEAENAGECIQHLLDQSYPAKNLELIIVNDRSTDETEKIVQKLSDENSLVKQIIINTTNKSFAPKKYAIDQAMKQAKGEIIVLTDADGRPGPGWIETVISRFARDVGMVIGYAPYTTAPPYNKKRYHLLSLEYLSHAAIACASAGLNYPLTCVGTNMAYRKEVYEQLAGFGQFKHIHTGDDDLFLQRVREETNWKIVYNSSCEGQVTNAPPATIKKFFHQRLRYASKGFLYPKIITGSLIAFYFFNLFIFLSPLYILFKGIYIFPVFTIALLKAFGDYHFLRTAASVLGHKEHLYLFPFAFLLHIPYVLLFGFLSQIKQFEWGSRKS